MATFQLAVTLGIMCAFLTDFVLSQLPETPTEACERCAAADEPVERALVCHQIKRAVGEHAAHVARVELAIFAHAAATAVRRGHPRSSRRLGILRYLYRLSLRTDW